MSDDNIWSDEWEADDDWSGGGSQSKRLPRGPQLGASVYELEPGDFVVYHFHHGTEELLIVLRGTPTVRMHDGDRTLAEGDVVPFPRGPEGGHQVRNDGDSVARVLIVAAHAEPDVVEYPETGTIAAVVNGEHRFHRTTDAVEHAGPEE